MSDALTIELNGQPRSFALGDGPASVAGLVEHLGLKADRIAIERNGEIVPRTAWAATEVVTGDKLEIVHFVGGG